MATMNSIDSSKGRLRGTYLAIMIPLGVAINYVGCLLYTSLLSICVTAGGKTLGDAAASKNVIDFPYGNDVFSGCRQVRCV